MLTSKVIFRGLDDFREKGSSGMNGLIRSSQEYTDIVPLSLGKR